MIALLLGLLLVGAASSCGTALLRPTGRIAFVLGTAVLAFAEIVAVSHGLSFVDAYERRWFLAVTAALALAALVAVAVVRPPWPSFRLGAVVREVLRDRVVAALAVVVAVELVYVFALAVVTPPNDTDGLTYHLMRGLLWIQQQSVSPVGGIRDTRIDEFQPDAEILQALTMLLSGSARYAQLVSFAALLVATLAIFGLASRIGFDRRRAAFGALLFPTLPIVALQAPTSLTDIVVAALVVTAAFFVLGRSPGELGLACVAVALLVGTKVTGLLSLPLLLAIALLTLRGRRLWLALAGGAAACVAGGAWFAVNLSEGEGAFGSLGEGSRGTGHGVTPIVARITRYAVESCRAARRDREGRAPLRRRRRGRRDRRRRALAARRRDDRRRPDRASAPRAARRGRPAPRVLARLGAPRPGPRDRVGRKPRPDGRLERDDVVRPGRPGARGRRARARRARRRPKDAPAGRGGARRGARGRARRERDRRRLPLRRTAAT